MSTSTAAIGRPSRRLSCRGDGHRARLDRRYLSCSTCVCRRRWVPPALKYAATFWDIAMISALVMASPAGPRSPLLYLYFVVLASAPLRLSLPLVYAATFGIMAAATARHGTLRFLPRRPRCLLRRRQSLSHRAKQRDRIFALGGSSGFVRRTVGAPGPAAGARLSGSRRRNCRRSPDVHPHHLSGLRPSIGSAARLHGRGAELSALPGSHSQSAASGAGSAVQVGTSSPPASSRLTEHLPSPPSVDVDVEVRAIAAASAA